MDDAYERRCRLLLRAYPPRYRRSRGAELLGTLLDAAEPGRDTPPLRDAWDVIRGGVLFRLRDRPPPHRWLAYRVLNTRLPYRHRWWVRDDVFGRGYHLRESLPGYAAMFLILWVAGAVMSSASGLPVTPAIRPTLWGLLIIAGIWLIPVPPLIRKKRERVLVQHEFHPDGTSYASGPWQPEGRPQPDDRPA
ncbi:hypothetical protein NE236_24850 [Actinoallomurus purpureus]|uniref:hypothetical protein n=1 Tax=Actinoallomurus purpureus TaxID=478114 RepID=UPI002093A4C1|nr:hypothetical protein [Actinoallomurus purpureus]MCO6008212.1 hypothetical protein [Actinoallomurus purpureus]